MKESVRLANYRKARLEEKMAENEEWLHAQVSGHHFDAVHVVCAAAPRIWKLSGKNKQKGKFDCMRVAATCNILEASGKYPGKQENFPELVPQDLCERWVKDLSSIRLGKAELSILARGLNFSVSPKTLLVTEVITQVEPFLSGSKLETDVADLV